MNERIVASVCSPYEIIISYPLTLDKYDNYINGINKNEYKKLFDIGKELNMKNNKLDTFNYNNTVYKDICTGIEIDGKDLVLEDRYKYLYPDDVFFCEHNCIMNNTDFELERINCLCNYKEEIDFEREDEDTELKVYTSSQSSANVEILKCLAKLTVKQSIKNNEAFYYCAVITVVEISLSLFSFLTSIKTVSSGYSTVDTDFDGRTLLRVESSNNANITVTKPASEDFVGLTLTIRKVSGDSSSLTINAGTNVTITPSDLTTLRRIGSTVTLLYIGNGVYDAFGELP